MATAFNKIYKRFYSKITDDMYMELEPQDTERLVQELLINAIDWFEFPRVNLNDYSISGECFNVTLSPEEINIIATYMVVGWLDQQLATVELTRMKYSGSDFKFTSQANHLAKLTTLRKEYERVGFHLQRLYKRRKADINGIMQPTIGSIMSSSVRGGVKPQPAQQESTEDTWEDMEDFVDEEDKVVVPGDDGWDSM